MRPVVSRALAACIAALLLLLFGTPLRVLWARPAAPWWLVYVLWGLAILALYALTRADRAEREGRQTTKTEGRGER